MAARQKLAGYPPQEPLSPAGQAYHEHVMELGANAAAGEDVAYGPDPYQRLLIYRASRSIDFRPEGAVLAFIHGGGWTNGYKEWMSFMAAAVTGAGITLVSIGYRLAPRHLFPTGLHDCANGLMLAHQLTAFAPLFVGGHSSGGHYAALLAVQPHWWQVRGLGKNPLKGCLPVSGVYRFGPGSGLSVRPRFLGSDDTERAASPITQIVDRTPFLIAYGEQDFPHLVVQAEEMIKALQAREVPVDSIALPGCDHFAASYQAGDAGGAWLARVAAFIARYQGV